MIVFLSWLTTFTLRSFFYNYLNYKFFSEEVKNKLFIILIFSGGILSLLKIADVRGPNFFYNSFKAIGLSGQIDQSFIAMPLLILFSQILRKKNDQTLFLFLLGALAAMSSYNFNIIFAFFVIYEFLSIEKENTLFGGLRKEIIIPLLVIFPFIFSSEKIFFEDPNLFGCFFLLLVLLNTLDICSIGYNRNDGPHSQLRDMILISPLRVSMLVYCASSTSITEYLGVGKIIFFFLLLASFFYGIVSHFNLKSLIVIVQALFLSSTLSALSRSHMEFYFLFGLLVLCGASYLDKKKSVEWLQAGLCLIVLLCFLDGPISLIRTFSLAFSGDNYSKIIGVFLLIFLVVLIFQWGQCLKNTKSIKIIPRGEYLILAACVVFNIVSDAKEHLPQVNWTNKIMLSFFFVIILLLSYIIGGTRISFKRFDIGGDFLKESIDRYLPSRILEGLLQSVFGKILVFISFIQGIIINFFFILVDTFEYKGVRKYQYLAMLLLITFLFLWMRVLGSNG